MFRSMSTSRGRGGGVCLPGPRSLQEGGWYLFPGHFQRGGYLQGWVFGGEYAQGVGTQMGQYSGSSGYSGGVSIRRVGTQGEYV